MVGDCKDHIITTLPLVSQGIKVINGNEVDGKELLPTDKHPFDHFLVYCKVSIE